MGTSTSPSASEQGLNILHEPRTNVTKPVNLIFVHGLGGSSVGTWTHPTTKAFWPALLREDPRFDNVRIATYGYDANYTNILGPKSILGIGDFAKQLLEHMDQHYHDENYKDVA